MAVKNVVGTDWALSVRYLCESPGKCSLGIPFSVKVQLKAFNMSLYLVAIVLLAASAMFPVPAYAYGDLSSASYFCQVILGAIFAGAISVKTLPALVCDAIRSLVRSHR